MDVPTNTEPDIRQTITQFVHDLIGTFPECKPIIAEWWGDLSEEQNYELMQTHCLAVYPAYFFDILYENADIFALNGDIENNNSDTTIELLPNIDFKPLWNSDISDATKSVIWKYLHLISFWVMGSVQNTNELDENTTKIFEKMQDENFQTKMQETMKSLFPEQIQEDGSNKTENVETEPVTKQEPNKVPFNFETMREHLSKLMEGKFGKMAQEMAQETANDLDIDLENTTELGDIFKKLMGNPAKLIEVAKKCGQKIKNKIKSGEVSESEMQAELMELMKAINPTGTKPDGANPMDGLKEMLGSMGIDMESLMKKFMGGANPFMNANGGGGEGAGQKNARMDVTKMNRMMQREEVKQRMRNNIAEKQHKKQTEADNKANIQAQRKLEYKPMTEAEMEMFNMSIAKNAKKPSSINKKKKK